MASPSTESTADDVDQRLRRIRQLTELGRRITNVSTPQQALEMVVQASARLFSGKALLAVRSDEGLQVRASAGIVGADGAELANTEIERRLQELMGESSERLLSVPLVVRSEVSGLLAVSAEDIDSDEAEWFLSALADQVAVSWESSRLDDLARHHSHRLDEEMLRNDEHRRLLEREQQARSEAEAERQRAEAANRAKDEFIAMISHELRTPLNAMLGWARMLRAGSLDAARSSKAIEIIERNARAQAQLVEDLLDIARITSGKMRLNRTMIDLSSVAQSALETAAPVAETRHVRLSSEVDPQLELFWGDADRMQQIVWNLLSNAVKFTPEGGLVQLRLERLDDTLVLSVRDTGEGIAPDFLPHVFERFRQADGGISRSHGGLGLGLAIVKHLVELHGGTIEATSEGIGRGATFTVRLPVQTAAQATPHEPRQVPLLPAGLKVLAIDDEHDARELLREILDQEGLQVRTAGSVAEAFKALAEQLPDVIVSDIGMPDEDGYSLVRRLRALPAEQGGRLPAIALTAYARTEDRTRALRAGFNLHLPKPIDPQELLAALTAVVRLPAS